MVYRGFFMELIMVNALLLHLLKIHISYIALIAGAAVCSGLSAAEVLWTGLTALLGVGSIVHILRSCLECGVQRVAGGIDRIYVLCFMCFFQFSQSFINRSFFISRNSLSF